MSWWCCCDTAAADRAHPHPRDPKYDRLIPTNNLLLSSTGGRIEGARPDPGGYSPPSVPASASRVPTIDDFVLLKTLGKGTFGKVMLCKHSVARRIYAIKVVPKAKLSTKKMIDQLVAELNIMMRVDHPFCISIQFAFQTETDLFYVLDFAAGGMLLYHLRQETRFSEPKARFYFGEIVLAIEYLHSLGVIFRDLKPENCLLSEKGHLKLADFGSAKKLGTHQKTQTLAGTPQYIAPEILKGDPYSFAADWWSCGIFLHEMMVGKPPFSSSDRVELYKSVLRSSFRVPSYVSPRAKDLLYKLIEKDPDMRLGGSDGGAQSAADIKVHLFFSLSPMEEGEEAKLVAEEEERQRHLDALEESRITRSFSQASSLVRNLSLKVRTLSGASQQLPEPCSWTWDELERRNVTPPFTPVLSDITDCRHFDLAMTSLPPTLERSTPASPLHIEGFSYVRESTRDGH